MKPRAAGSDSPFTSSDGRFARWIEHRASLLNLLGVSELASKAGLAETAVRQVLKTSSLGPLERSGRAWLARALKVPLRDLEALADDRRAWIDDRRHVDLDHAIPSAASRGRSRENPPRFRSARPESGVPVVGSLRGARIDWFAASPADSIARLPVTYDDMPDAFALVHNPAVDPRRSRADSHLIFTPSLPEELRPGMSVLVTEADGTPGGRTLFGRIAAAGAGSAILLTGEAGEAQAVEPSQMLRCAELAARYQES